MCILLLNPTSHPLERDWGKEGKEGGGGKREENGLLKQNRCVYCC
jgi:hypothetical protein